MLKFFVCSMSNFKNLHYNFDCGVMSRDNSNFKIYIRGSRSKTLENYYIGLKIYTFIMGEFIINFVEHNMKYLKA